VEYFPSGMEDERGHLSGYIERPDHGSFQVVAEVDWSSTLSGGIITGPMGEYLGRNVFFGFTAANGLATDGHAITSINVVPEPETYALLLAGLGLVGYAARRRKAKRQA